MPGSAHPSVSNAFSGGSSGFVVVTAPFSVIPQAEMHLYATDLNSMTQGRATFSHRFRGYEEVPPDAAQKIIAESAKQREEVLAEA